MKDESTQHDPIYNFKFIYFKIRHNAIPLQYLVRGFYLQDSVHAQADESGCNRLNSVPHFYLLKLKYNAQDYKNLSMFYITINKKIVPRSKCLLFTAAAPTAFISLA